MAMPGLLKKRNRSPRAACVSEAIIRSKEVGFQRIAKTGVSESSL
jgi:hypothetical protein